MKIFRRGQASIEFALILPIFAMLLFALVYVGFLFIDVVTLDSVAAAAARSAAASTDGELSDPVKDKIKGTKLFLYWYEMDAASPKVSTDANGFVTAMIQVKLTDKVKNNSVLNKILPEKYTVSKKSVQGVSHGTFGEIGRTAERGASVAGGNTFGGEGRATSFAGAVGVRRKFAEPKS